MKGKSVKWKFGRWVAFISLIASLVIISSCHIARFFYYNFADIKDYKKFPSRSLHNDSAKFQFSNTEHKRVPKTITDQKTNTEIGFDTYLQSDKTVAFLIIVNDVIQYEKYFSGYNERSIVPSFSMAKSMTSILIGCAIDDGLIWSVDDPVTNYLPELKKNGLQVVTIKNLLQMNSGIKYTEQYYNPFGDVARFYYGRHLHKYVGKMKLKYEPGKEFEYQSGNVQVLGLILEKVLYPKTITEYFQDKIWRPLGMEYDASWSIDKKKNGTEKTFCCVNACARDFAKIGRLYLKKGNWNGKQIISEKWVVESIKIDSSAGNVWYYHYNWGIPTGNGDFMAVGFLGQYIYVNPSKNMIIVRLGKNEGKINWPVFLRQLANSY